MPSPSQPEDLEPVDLFRAGSFALGEGKVDKARPLLVEALLRYASPIGYHLLEQIQDDVPTWRAALASARCAGAAAELAHDFHDPAGLGALRVAVNARLAQIELLLHLGQSHEADPVLDETFALMRGVEDASLKASLWWTAANVARRHGRSSTQALALQRAAATGALGALDGPELQLSFAEACMEAGWKERAVAAVRELDGASLSKRNVGRLLGLQGALILQKEPAAAFARWARAEKRLAKAGARRELGQLRVRMARAAVTHGVHDPVDLLLDVLDARFQRALPDLPRHVVAVAAEVATKRELPDLALLAEIELERHDADVEASWRRQAALLSDMGFPAEASELVAMDRAPEVPRLPGDSFPPTADVSNALANRDSVARGVRVRRHLTHADFASADGLRDLLQRIRMAGHKSPRMLRDDF